MDADNSRQIHSAASDVLHAIKTLALRDMRHDSPGDIVSAAVHQAAVCSKLLPDVIAAAAAARARNPHTPRRFAADSMAVLEGFAQDVALQVSKWDDAAAARLV